MARIARCRRERDTDPRTKPGSAQTHPQFDVSGAWLPRCYCVLQFSRVKFRSYTHRTTSPRRTPQGRHVTVSQLHGIGVPCPLRTRDCHVDPTRRRVTRTKKPIPILAPHTPAFDDVKFGRRSGSASSCSSWGQRYGSAIRTS